MIIFNLISKNTTYTDSIQIPHFKSSLIDSSIRLQHFSKSLREIELELELLEKENRTFYIQRRNKIVTGGTIIFFLTLSTTIFILYKKYKINCKRLPPSNE